MTAATTASPPANSQSLVTHAPTFSFITIRDPGESALPTNRRAVRSHAAYHQHQQDARTRNSTSLQRRKHRKLRRVAVVSGRPIIISSSPSSSSTSDGTQSSGTTLQQVRSRYMNMTSPQPRTPRIGQGRIGPFRTYPVPWEPSIPDLVDHYLTHMAVDLPELDEPQTPGLLRTRWFPMVMTEAATFQVIMLLAASHFASFQSRRCHGRNLLQLKAKAISLVGPALATYGPTDQLIGAVAKMAAYEALFRDQTPYEAHMKGLLKMVALRGGLSELGLNGMLARLCVWIDGNAATLHNRPVCFTAVPKSLSCEVNLSGFLGIDESEHRVTEVW